MCGFDGFTQLDATADQHDPAIKLLGIGLQLGFQPIHHGLDHGILLTLGHRRSIAHLACAGAGNGGGRAISPFARFGGAQCSEAGGDVNLRRLANFCYGCAHVRNPRGVWRRILEQREKAIERTDMIARLFFGQRGEIACPRVGGVNRQRLGKGGQRIGRHSPIARHHQRFPQRGPAFCLVRSELCCLAIGECAFCIFFCAVKRPAQPHPAFDIVRILLEVRLQLGDQYAYFFSSNRRFGGGFRRALALPDFDAHGSRRQQGRNPQRPKRQVGSLCRRWFLHFAPRSDFHAGAL